MSHCCHNRNDTVTRRYVGKLFNIPASLSLSAAALELVTRNKRGSDGDLGAATLRRTGMAFAYA